MGMFSVVLIAHDGLHEIGEDKNFGKNLSTAIMQNQGLGDGMKSVHAGNHSNPVEIIGRCFHGDDMQVIVIEGGTGWVAKGQKKPNWSVVTSEMIKKLFSGIT